MKCKPCREPMIEAAPIKNPGVFVCPKCGRAGKLLPQQIGLMDYGFVRLNVLDRALLTDSFDTPTKDPGKEFPNHDYYVNQARIDRANASAARTDPAGEGADQ